MERNDFFFFPEPDEADGDELMLPKIEPSRSFPSSSASFDEVSDTELKSPLKRVLPSPEELEDEEGEDPSMVFRRPLPEPPRSEPSRPLPPPEEDPEPRIPPSSDPSWAPCVFCEAASPPTAERSRGAAMERMEEI